MRLILKILAKGLFQKLIALLALDCLLYFSTNARNVASLILIVGFVLLLATSYYIFYGLIAISQLYGFKVHHQNRLALSLTGVFGALIALQSVGELSPHDVIVLLPLGLIAYLYSSYGAKKRDQLL
jgi:predicted membrane protein